MPNISDDYYHIVTPNRQVYTSKEIGIPGIRLFGHLLEYKADKPLELHIHMDCIEICFISKGNQIYKLTDKEYLLTGNTVFITLPNELHGSGSDPFGKLELYWIQLNTKVENEFLSLASPYSDLLLNALFNIKNRNLKCDNDIKPLLDDSLANLISPDNSKKMFGLSCFLLFLNKIIKYDEADFSGISPQIQKSINYICENTDKKTSLAFLANYIGLSLPHFKKRFKKETGDTPNNYINYLKIKKAKEMLKLNVKSITEIAYDLDFSSSSYFTVVFKRYTNISPIQYIKSKKI